MIPTIDDVKAFQAKLGLPDVHICWLGEEEFVIAHTDRERATIDLTTCELHRLLRNMEASPVSDYGYYAYIPELEFFWFLCAEAPKK
jgi:hypothetical protein